MEKTIKIIRKTIHSFLQNDLHFTFISLLLALPFSFSVLLSQSLLSSSPASSNLLLNTTLKSFFSSKALYSLWLLNPNLFQIIFISFSTLPLTLSSLLLSKASVVQAFLLRHRRNNQSSLSLHFCNIKSLYKPLLKTHLCNILLIIATQSSIFALSVFILKLVQLSGFTDYNLLVIFTSKSLMQYVLVNIVVNGNLALVISGMEHCEGHVAVYKAWSVVMGKNSMAIMLALPFSLGLTATEALFQYRVARLYRVHGMVEAYMVFEGLVIAFMYSFLLVLDTTASCLFFHTFKTDLRSMSAE